MSEAWVGFADVPGTAAISYAAAKRLLQKARPWDTSAALFGLRRVKIALESVRILRYFNGEDVEEASGLLTLLDDPFKELDFEGVAVETAAEAFPAMWMVHDHLLNIEPNDQTMDYFLVIDPKGVNWTLDDLDLMMYSGDITDYFSKNYGALVFGKFLDIGSDIDVEIWQKAIAAFRWPKRLPLTVLAEVEFVDGDEVLKRLEAAGLADWVTVFKVVFCQTDNPFLDWSSEDAYTQPFRYTLESAQKLRLAWREAEDILVQCFQAQALTNVAPKHMEQVLDIWDACTKLRPGSRPQTLAEIWTNDPVVGLDAEPEHVIDEFYGPLDGWEAEMEDEDNE